MNQQNESYLIIDAGTGNVRVAVVDPGGQILTLQRDNVDYIKDTVYPEALEFDPGKLWNQIVNLINKALSSVSGTKIVAITASSQREGVVLVDESGHAIVGFPNHDHRGREWQHIVENKSEVYQLTGRFPSSLFSAFKLVGLREKYPELYGRVDKMLSISDWIQYQLSGIQGYEYSQASETLLLNVEEKHWSEELCGIFKIDEQLLPDLVSSGMILGEIRPEYAEKLKIDPTAKIIVGGADTQLAIKSNQPGSGDIVIVSGTTTPITRVMEDYVLDPSEQSWTNRHTDMNQFILETNCGVTGLNFQQLKEVFYPNEEYSLIEEELTRDKNNFCVSSLGSLVVGEERTLTRGGFVFDVPMTYSISRAAFVRSILWDIACSIKDNFEHLCSVVPFDQEYVYGCGGGFQSPTLTRFTSTLIGKEVRIRKGFQNASIIGAILVCNEALGVEMNFRLETETIKPDDFSSDLEQEYQTWKKVREGFGYMFR